MTKRVWEDIEFFERVMEFASDDFTRGRLSVLISEARTKMIKQIEDEFIEGGISAYAFKNIMGSPPSAALVKRCLAWYRFTSKPLHENAYTRFTRKALFDVYDLPIKAARA